MNKQMIDVLKKFLIKLVKLCSRECDYAIADAKIKTARKRQRTRPIGKYSLNGKLIKKYSSINEAVADNTGTVKTNIVACARGRRRSCGGYKWRYLDE